MKTIYQLANNKEKTQYIIISQLYDILLPNVVSHFQIIKKLQNKTTKNITSARSF